MSTQSLKKCDIIIEDGPSIEGYIHYHCHEPNGNQIILIMTGEQEFPETTIT
jgi:hypothetical protein